MSHADTVIPPSHKIRPFTSYGLITNDINGLGEVRNLVGGTGAARWKQVINGMHLPGGWGPVEYVELPPGSSCGEHLHAAREEIYYILAGSARIRVNGQALTVAAGDLITCPLGTVHGIGVPTDASGPMRFFVIEMSPGQAPPCPPVRIRVGERMRGCLGYRGYPGDDLRVASIDLARHFSGPWRMFAAIEVPPEETLGPYRRPAGTAEVLFVAGGDAHIAAGPDSVKGGLGLCVGSGPGSTLTIRNPSGERPLLLISTEVTVQ